MAVEVEKSVPPGKLLGFLASGLPAFALAVPFNWLLVEVAHLNKLVAYALVLIFQVSTNFLMCRLFVFRGKGTRHWLAQFWELGTGSMGFRVLEWCVYAFAVHVLGLYYLAVQFANVFLFCVPKFVYARWVMER